MKVYAVVSGYYPEKIHHLYDPMYSTREAAIKMLHEICDTLNLRNKQCAAEDNNFDSFEYLVDEEAMLVYHTALIKTTCNQTDAVNIPCAWVEIRELL